MEWNSRISLSENGWTDNKLCMEWMRDCFHPETKDRLRGDYRMLIVDGHASHVSTEFIRFAREHKIVCLCLPAHSTHLLQPLDVGVFGPLKQNYKTLLAEKTRFTTYNLDKADFISLIQKARQQGINSRNIQSAWRATGLIPYDPSVVFNKISTPNTEKDTLPTASTPLRTRFFSGQIPLTPGNIEQVEEVDELISLFRNQTLDSPKLTLLHKTLKAARLAMADRIVLNRTNTELLAANTRKRQRAQRTGIQYDGQGARVLSMEDVEKRRELADSKKKEKEAKSQAKKEKQDDRVFSLVLKDLIRLGPDLIYGSSPVSPRLLQKNKKRDDSIFQNAFHELLQITPDIFAETVTGDPKSKTSIQTKGKGPSKKKNTSVLVQDDEKLVDRGEQEKFSGVRVSKRGRIIRNTSKM